MTGSSQCPHSDVHYHLNLAAFGDTNLRYVEISGHCKLCSAQMLFRGRMGMGPSEPGISPDGSEVRLPMLFAGEDLAGRPVGFTIRAGGS